MDKFWSKVNREDPDECWEWEGSRSGGYGHVRFQPYRGETAHRVAFKLDHGESPDDYVLHTCDNKACVNPAHLYVGDQSDNMQDASDAGSLSRGEGEDHPNAKLTEDDVREIREKDDGTKDTRRKLADKFGVSRSMVGQIARGDAWDHID